MYKIFHFAPTQKSVLCGLFQAFFQLCFSDWTQRWGPYSQSLLSEQREDTPPIAPPGAPTPPTLGLSPRQPGPSPPSPVSASRESLPHPASYWCPGKEKKTKKQKVKDSGIQCLPSGSDKIIKFQFLPGCFLSNQHRISLPQHCGLHIQYTTPKVHSVYFRIGIQFQ